MSLIVFGLIFNVHAAERVYQVVLPILNQRDILLHVFMPQNTPKGVLIALHGCGGLLTTNTKNGDKLSSRHAGMAQFANDLIGSPFFQIVLPRVVVERYALRNFQNEQSGKEIEKMMPSPPPVGLRRKTGLGGYRHKIKQTLSRAFY